MTNKKKRYRVKRMQNKETNDKSLMKHEVKNLMKVYMPRHPKLLVYPYILSSRVISPIERTRIQETCNAYRRKVHELSR